MFDAQRCFSELFEEEIARGSLAGCNILVSERGKELFSGSYGFSDIAGSVPMRRDAVFRMFSMSKPVTSAAVMILAERGRLDLNDPAGKYLEGFRDQTVSVKTADGRYENIPAAKPVLIRDLMNMTSGVSYPGDTDPSHIAAAECLAEWERKLRSYDHPGTVDFMNAIGRCPLAFTPGERWMYGFSADVLGAIVEVVSGMSFGEFLRREIFDPLGMYETGFDVKPGMRERMAHVYERSYDGSPMKEFTGMNLGLGDFPDRPIFESGGAGLLSTLDDYSKFIAMLAAGGTYKNARILSRNTVRFMGSDQLTPAQKVTLDWDSLKGYGYGNLMRVLESPAMQVTNAPAGEFGWDGWLGTYMIVEPASGRTILFLRQTRDCGTDDITRKVRAIAYAI